MNMINRHRGVIFRTLISFAAAAGIAGLATPASAYKLYDEASCKPGQKWDTSRPVKVRLLADSVTGYLTQRGGTLVDAARLDHDVKAVIDLYNSIPGSSLVLEQDVGITGDSELDSPTKDNFGDQTIVIGFTSTPASSDPSAEAYTKFDPNDGCTRTRAHIAFRKTDSSKSPKLYGWVFGPPDTTDVDGRSFSTNDQPGLGGGIKPITFLGILTHEMGHAVGLDHPLDNYAVMAQNFRTWFREKNHTLGTRLLPDDTAGIRALYDVPSAHIPLDISVTNSWYWPPEAQIATNCKAEVAAVDAAQLAFNQASGLPTKADLFIALQKAKNALDDCTANKAATNALQIDNCMVSSRADDWADKTSVNTSCGVNTSSAFPEVSDQVCPGKQIQVRYTLNNHTNLREVSVKSEVWFSSDTKLDVQDGIDQQSPDIHEDTIKAASSENKGHVFRLPANAIPGPSGQLFVFVRAVPYDAQTGASLWDSDVAQWNNAIMVRHSITVASSVCPPT
jgi:Matrixin